MSFWEEKLILRKYRKFARFCFATKKFEICQKFVKIQIKRTE